MLKFVKDFANTGETADRRHQRAGSTREVIEHTGARQGDRL